MTDLAQRKGFEGVGLFALVRSDEQIKSFESVAGVEVVRGDLKDEKGIVDIVLKHKSEFTMGLLSSSCANWGSQHNHQLRDVHR